MPDPRAARNMTTHVTPRCHTVLSAILLLVAGADELQMLLAAASGPGTGGVFEPVAM